MTDKFKPMGLDLTKNLHGHVRVETRDRWTGRVVDSQEKDNLVTNALSKIYKESRGASISLWQWFSPIYAKALGGLLIFDTALTESADNIHFPGTSKLVGFAGQSANTSLPMAGSWNEAESVIGSNNYTTVWDFQTSQVNATIAALARTSYEFPEAGIGGRSSVFSLSNLGPYSWGNPLQPLGYDPTNKYIYLAVSSQSTYGGTTYTTDKIYRAYCDFEAQPLLGKYFIPDPDKWTAVVTVSSSTDGTSDAYSFTYDPYSDLFYYGTGTKIYTITPGGVRNNFSTPANISATYNIVATENYYWYTYSGTVYRIKKSNTADTASVTPTFGSATRLIALADDSVMVGGASGTTNRALIYADLSVVYLTLYQTISNYDVLAQQYNYSRGRCPMLLGPYMALNHAINSSTAAYPGTYSAYLGTIANLDSPVTKTSSQTMKVTYTLTEA